MLCKFWMFFYLVNGKFCVVLEDVEYGCIVEIVYCVVFLFIVGYFYIVSVKNGGEFFLMECYN